MTNLSAKELLKRLWEGAYPPGRATLTARDVAAIVHEYTGEAPLEVAWAADPKVPDCTAIRATFARKRVLDLIVYRRAEGNDIEEVEFHTWPPRSV